MPKKFIYVADSAKGLNFRLNVADKDIRIKFENGQYSTDDEEIAKAIDHALATTNLGRFARKVDRASAEKLAKEHQAMLERTGAHKGGVTAHAMQEAMKTQINERDRQLQAVGGDPLIEEFDKEENLVLTKAADPVVDLPVGEPEAEQAPPENEAPLATESAAPQPGKLKIGK